MILKPRQAQPALQLRADAYMKILVANLGSTSFKYRLFDLPGETQLARGGIDRIGKSAGNCFVQIGDKRDETTRRCADHAEAVRICLDQLTNSESGCVASVSEVAAIGFKAVFAGRLSGVRVVDDELLAAMESLATVAPAHNPPYARAMRELRKAFPEIPLVAALETGFHETIPEAERIYAVPYEWKTEHDVQRWGFHGASHRYIAGRIGEILERHDLRVISCHLGGSNSLCAIRAGKSLATSMGMSPQTGLPHNNRVGDFDPFALPVLMQATGKSLETLLAELAERSGLLGISGLSGDVRDLEEAAAKGHARAELALNAIVASIRHYVGAYLVVLGGADAVVFTGGIGENSQRVRTGVCRDLEWAGLRLDATRNASVKGETRISGADSRVEVWVVPTNEELVVARQAAELIA
ncbi:MAG TPA: acetate/propionate family kinase, partial [Planctomycetaceae bacterium]|nr:acetate/propionate family kinase [Planctomycetaceae bacterium]